MTKSRWRSLRTCPSSNKWQDTTWLISRPWKRVPMFDNFIKGRNNFWRYFKCFIWKKLRRPQQWWNNMVVLLHWYERLLMAQRAYQPSSKRTKIEICGKYNLPYLKFFQYMKIVLHKLILKKEVISWTYISILVNTYMIK